MSNTFSFSCVKSKFRGTTPIPDHFYSPNTHRDWNDSYNRTEDALIIV